MNQNHPVRYRIYPSRPHAHLLRIRCSVSDPDPAGQRLSMPAWIPGSYMIRDFARHVVSLSASTRDGPIQVSRLDKSTWVCVPTSEELHIDYEVYAWDLSVRGAHLDATHGFFNGTSVFLLAQGREHHPCEVEILPPEGEAYARWRLATALSPTDATQAYGFGLYRAADYDELIDHPVEMGEFTLGEFEACGVPHAIAVTGHHRADMERLCRDLKRVCEHHIRFFGEPAPMRRYLFLVTVVGDGYGGLEHRASTSLLCSRYDLPAAGLEAPDEAYRGFLGLCSHEYFHSWNVKRIKPAVFCPYDLSREVHTRLLWAFEGITSYYDDLGLLRCGLIDADGYLELLGRTITRVLRTPGRFRQSVSDSSFDAWTRFYRQDENAPNAIVSYYAKGTLIALALDLRLRLASGGEHSLDEVMAALWQRHGLDRTGIGEEQLERLAAEVTGVELGGFFDTYLRGTEDLPLADLFPQFGISLCLRPAESTTDKGGKPGAKPLAELRRRGTLGARTATSGGEAELAAVLDDGAAQTAGLAAGDVVVAVDGLRVQRDNLEQRLGDYPPGTRLRLHAFRRDELMEFPVDLQPPADDTCYLRMDTTADPVDTSRGAAWLEGKKYPRQG